MEGNTRKKTIMNKLVYVPHHYKGFPLSLSFFSLGLSIQLCALAPRFAYRCKLLKEIKLAPDLGMQRDRERV